MPLTFAFDKGERGGLGCFVKEETMFDHYGDTIISIRLNSDSAKGKDGEADEAIDATLRNVDIYRKDVKKTKDIGQCTNSGVG